MSDQQPASPSESTKRSELEEATGKILRNVNVAFENILESKDGGIFARLHPEGFVDGHIKTQALSLTLQEATLRMLSLLVLAVDKLAQKDGAK